ncbi:MAG: imidazole glycerol phosphate synthase subunit HisH [Clostridia bacterium]|nr:imidazole glycerol phosphate synthase subunit HisH [Clostridia bacterium]
MIGIVDYGVGNLYSLGSSLSALSLEHTVSGDCDVLSACDRIILPGVGAFADASKKLNEAGLDKFLLQQAADGKPLMGICLGMQLLFDVSYEFGTYKGLGLISGSVCPLLGDLPGGLKVPHMGWNSLNIMRDDSLLKYVKQGEYMYFVHSFYAKDCDADVIATTHYGIPVTAVVRRGNVMGAQFHPEKSGAAGLAILKAFSEI